LRIRNFGFEELQDLLVDLTIAMAVFITSLHRRPKFRPDFNGSPCAQPAGMNLLAQELPNRVRQFAVRAGKFLRTLPRDPVTLEIVRQLAKSSGGMSKATSASALSWMISSTSLANCVQSSKRRTTRPEPTITVNAQHVVTNHQIRDKSPQSGNPQIEIRKSSNPEILKFQRHQSEPAAACR
jgi:hypothetical protein